MINLEIGDLLHSHALGFGLVLNKNYVKPPTWATNLFLSKNISIKNKVNQVDIFWSGGEEVQSITSSHILELIDWDSTVDTIQIVSRANGHINDVD